MMLWCFINAKLVSIWHLTSTSPKLIWMTLQIQISLKKKRLNKKMLTNITVNKS